MEFDLSGHGTDKEAQLWIPYPLSDADQLITDILVSGDYTESAVFFPVKNPFFFAKEIVPGVPPHFSLAIFARVCI
jgi:hypothetical protein